MGGESRSTGVNLRDAQAESVLIDTCGVHIRVESMGMGVGHARRSVGLAAFNFRQSKLVRYSGAFTIDAIKSFLSDVAADKLKVMTLPKVCFATPSFMHVCVAVCVCFALCFVGEKDLWLCALMGLTLPWPVCVCVCVCLSVCESCGQLPPLVVTKTADGSAASSPGGSDEDDISDTQSSQPHLASAGAKGAAAGCAAPKDHGGNSGGKCTAPPPRDEL